jgi:tRNA (cmo5U34)-methyltransferase
MVTTKEFYDRFSSRYTEAILKCVPRYQEMLSALFYYLPDGFAPSGILELGCGTGNLSALVLRHFPNARFTAVDISGECISECKARLNDPSIEFIQEDFSKLTFPEGSFDLVVSSISIHHLADFAKKRLFQHVHGWLASGGFLTFSDQFRGETEELYRKHMELWRSHASENNVTEEEWATWIEHQELHDHHSPLKSHLDWLAGCGFERPDCVWRYSLWAVICAAKA